MLLLRKFLCNWALFGWKWPGKACIFCVATGLQCPKNPRTPQSAAPNAPLQHLCPLWPALTLVSCSQSAAVAAAGTASASSAALAGVGHNDRHGLGFSRPTARLCKNRVNAVPASHLHGLDLQVEVPQDGPKIITHRIAS